MIWNNDIQVHHIMKKKNKFLVTRPYLAKPYTIWRNLYTFRQNPIQFGETTDFRQKVYTFWQKNPRTEVHPLPNVKMPLKTQENNVTFRPM